MKHQKHHKGPKKSYENGLKDTLFIMLAKTKKGWLKQEKGRLQDWMLSLKENKLSSYEKKCFILLGQLLQSDYSLSTDEVLKVFDGIFWLRPKSSILDTLRHNDDARCVSENELLRVLVSSVEHMNSEQAITMLSLIDRLSIEIQGDVQCAVDALLPRISPADSYDNTSVEDLELQASISNVLRKRLQESLKPSSELKKWNYDQVVAHMPHTSLLALHQFRLAQDSILPGVLACAREGIFFYDLWAMLDISEDKFKRVLRDSFKTQANLEVVCKMCETHPEYYDLLHEFLISYRAEEKLDLQHVVSTILPSLFKNHGPDKDRVVKFVHALLSLGVGKKDLCQISDSQYAEEMMGVIVAKDRTFERQESKEWQVQYHLDKEGLSPDRRRSPETWGGQLWYNDDSGYLSSSDLESSSSDDVDRLNADTFRLPPGLENENTLFKSLGI